MLFELEKVLNLPLDWNNEHPSKLWTYNLHYFEDLLTEDASQFVAFHHKLLNLWIDQNPVGLELDGTHTLHLYAL